MKNSAADIVEVAGKRRHIHLLQKVQSARALSAAELKELETYEDMAKKSAKKKKSLPAAGPVSDEIIIGQGEAAKWLGVTARTIRRYVKEGMPRTQDGHYLRTLLKFYKANRGEEDIEHRAKGRLLDINLKELKVREKEHALGEAERRWRAEQEKKTVRQIRLIVDAHRRMINKLPPLLARANKESQVKAILQAECRDICDGFAKGMKARSEIFD